MKERIFDGLSKIIGHNEQGCMLSLIYYELNEAKKGLNMTKKNLYRLR